MLVGDHDLLSVLRVELAAGRMFSRDIASDTASAFLLNEEAARQLGWSEPLKGQIAMPAIGRAAGPVIGVVKDFHFRSMREAIMPLLFFIPPPNWFSSFAIRVAPGRMDEAVAFLEKRFAEYDPAHPFRYIYFDEQFERLHAAEERMGELLTLVSVTAIALACLGLFGLAAFSAERRTKEIGVRKVLGATTTSLVSLLSTEFMKLVIVANVIAWPAGYLAMTAWLGEFAYRTEVTLWTFVVTGLLSILIAVATVASQSIRVARANPVNSLRYE
jgi:putative ABC transport system permease protein